MLNQKEYEILNRMIKNIYHIKGSGRMRQEVLLDLKKLIGFRFSVFSLGILKNKRVYLTDSIVNSDFEKDFEDEFLSLSETQYEVSDYAAWIFQIPESIVYKDSEIVNDELRKKTPYYKDYLYAHHLPHVAGISIVSDERFMGALTLYKTERAGDFTEKDLFILDFLRPHLETRLAEDDSETGKNKKNISYLLKSKYHMTSREIEILGLIFTGESNEDIAEKLMIAESTVKKHVSHIYEKLDCTGRSHLIQFVLKHDIGHLWEKEEDGS